MKKDLPSPLMCGIIAGLFALLTLWSATTDGRVLFTLSQAGLSVIWIVLAVISWKRKRKNTAEKVNN